MDNSLTATPCVTSGMGQHFSMPPGSKLELRTTARKCPWEFRLICPGRWFPSHLQSYQFFTDSSSALWRTDSASESSLSCYPTSGQSSSRTTTFPAASYSNYANLSGNIQKNNLSSVKLEYTAWKPIDIWPFPLPAPCSCQLLGWVPWKPFPSLLLNRKVGVCVSMCACLFLWKYAGALQIALRRMSSCVPTATIATEDVACGRLSGAKYCLE